jgi:hypothetical protein
MLKRAKRSGRSWRCGGMSFRSDPPPRFQFLLLCCTGSVKSLASLTPNEAEFEGIFSNERDEAGKASKRKCGMAFAKENGRYQIT